MNEKGKPARKPEPNRVDEASAESFPASDPPSYMGSTAVAGAPKEHRSGNGAKPTVTEERKEVDLNTASIEELGSLTAITPDMAQTLIDERPFDGWDDVAQLPGFDKDVIENMKKGGACFGT
jgi:DNA uptake protein ComE-like DNA-binding protein